MEKQKDVKKIKKNLGEAQPENPRGNTNIKNIGIEISKNPSIDAKKDITREISDSDGVRIFNLSNSDMSIDEYNRKIDEAYNNLYKSMQEKKNKRTDG